MLMIGDLKDSCYARFAKIPITANPRASQPQFELINAEIAKYCWAKHFMFANHVFPNRTTAMAANSTSAIHCTAVNLQTCKVDCVMIEFFD
jgi:hypothetical protein